MADHIWATGPEFDTRDLSLTAAQIQPECSKLKSVVFIDGNEMNGFNGHN